MSAYDTVDGIQSYLTDLEGLNRLFEDRHEAGKRNEKLQSYIILGRWSLMSGHTGRAILELGHQVAPWVSELSPVISHDDLYAIFPNLVITTMGRDEIPPAHVTCFECQELWTLSNAHDTLVFREWEKLETGKYEGRTLEEIQNHLEKDTRASYVVYMGPDAHQMLSNPTWIDLTPDAQGQPINKNGVAPPSVVVDKDYRLQPGDSLDVQRWTYLHTKCAEIARTRGAQKFYRELLDRAGCRGASFELIKNEYDPQGAPWCLAHTYKGDFKMGRRKRVFHFDWEDTKRDLQYLFEDETVTKGPRMIHAYSEEALASYISRVADALRLCRP